MQRILISIIIIAFSIKLYSQENKHELLPKYQLNYEKQSEVPAFRNHLKISISQRPDDIIIPAEYEETQAVVIAWPYPWFYNEESYHKFWSKLADVIQHECEVWILVDTYSDTTEVIDAMSQQGVSLYNHKFIEHPTNSYWVRDSGPWGFYYSDSDSIGIIDLSYYSNRPKDDTIPHTIGRYMAKPVYSSSIKMEGGNFMVDGFGHGFYSNRLNEKNIDINNWTWQDTYDTITSVFDLSNTTELSTLICDGSTGHIDMYMKLFDEQTLIVSEYPNTMTTTDRDTIEANIARLQMLESTYGRPFKIHRMMLPTNDNGDLPISCDDINSDARGFINGLLVNKTFIMPAYSSINSGNIQLDSMAVKMYRKLLPGYNIVPIDARLLTPMGGAIHCVTMQIPAENPIRFWHPSIEGMQNDKTSYHLLAKITNKSGIETAKCYWKRKYETIWEVVDLEDSSGFFVGEIPNDNFTATDTIIYYLEATSNNQKTMQKPITAPCGYYSFYFNENMSANHSLFKGYNNHYLFSAYPNPVKSYANIQYYMPVSTATSCYIEVFDLQGKIAKKIALKETGKGLHNIRIDFSNITAGMYFYRLLIPNSNTENTYKKIIKVN